MQLQPTKLSEEQVIKVVKALAYSFVSAFISGIVLSLVGFLQGVVNHTQVVSLNAFRTFLVAAMLAAVVSAINATIVLIKQLFTPVS
jgi:hypothetical protein